MGLRIKILIGFICLAYSALTFNIYNLQITKGAYYRVRAAALHGYLTNPTPIRGSIYFTDRDNNQIPASINKDQPTIFVDNKEVKDIPEVAESLASIFHKPSADIYKLLGSKDDVYAPIVKRATVLEVKAITDAKITGVHIENEPGRYYPFGSLASHVIGFVSKDVQNPNGLYGSELYFNKELQGDAKENAAGEDLHLTIDRDIQAEAEKILKNVVDQYKGNGGTVIVEDPKTGKILAMADYPTFDPNNYSASEIKNFLNPAVQAIYEPGSIMKIVTMSAGIDSGAITPDTTFFDSGSATFNKKTIKNFGDKSYGKITMTNVIEHSVNTGAVFAERTMGNVVFYKYLVRFGFADKTGVDLPGEVSGGLKAMEKNARDINFATASFGQGISVTPLALINAVSVVANGGLLMTPYINADDSPKIVDRVISEDTAKKVQKMLVTALNTNEIGKISSYNVAGKTGTAQVPDFKHGGYTDQVINTYIGFAPAYDPRFVILVKLNEPAGAPQAGLTVVPAFRELAQFILNYYNIPPDNIDKAKQ